MSIPAQEISSVAEPFFENVITRHRKPSGLHFNQGQNFDSEICEMALMDMKKTRTTSLHPQYGGIVEKYTRIINNYLSLFVSKNERDSYHTEAFSVNLQVIHRPYRSMEEK